ncbi:MAG: hypothetical protein ACLQJ7_03810 [Syntrophobacteraceae bacterium]
MQFQDAPCNTPVQTNGADGFKLALYLISRGLEGVDARIVHTQHDEIIVEARDGIEDQVLTIVKESIEEAFQQIISGGIRPDSARVCSGEDGRLSLYYFKVLAQLRFRENDYETSI